KKALRADFRGQNSNFKIFHTIKVTNKQLALQTDNLELKVQAERLEDELYGKSDQKKEIKDLSANSVFKGEN
ncbi:MAG: hypothetical protein KAU47_04255, partial [Candidatus Aminicenantes bacterium]|nr:hypothetical protein [Candidatus Aminicenantes bacterium]